MSRRKHGPGSIGPEFDLIERLVARLPSGDGLPEEARRALEVGAGDDATVWLLGDGSAGVLTIDTLVEGVHAFPHEPPADVGARALTAAASDVAAMGARALLALVALQCPRGVEDERLILLYDGIAEEAALLGMAVVGGDVVDTPGPLALAVAVFGHSTDGRVWLRSGARPGDVLVVTGDLGGSRAGLELLTSGSGGGERADWAERLTGRHLRPRARLAAAAFIKEMDPAGVHAALDISDGLSSDAWHMALRSNVQIALEAAWIPLHPDLETYLATRSGDRGIAPVRYALDSGEEYELLLALSPDHQLLDRMEEGSVLPDEVGIGFTVVGTVAEGTADVILVDRDGREEPIRPGGWSHRVPDGDPT